MNKKFPLIFFCIFFLPCAVLAQTPVSPSGEDDVVKITSKLVQFDVVVTDKEGRQVTDLSARDFSILQDGKPQKITNLTYVRGVASARAASGSGTVSPGKIDAANRRVLTFVLDDGNCNTTAMSVLAMRDAMEKFVKEQMLDSDVVAIYQTRGGSSVLQQYTSDRAKLLRIAKGVRWYPNPGICFATGGDSFDPAKSYSDENSVVGSIGLMRYIVRGLDRLPGRKVVFFLSNGLPIFSSRGTYNQAFDSLRDLTDRANRAGVIFNTISAGGLSDGMFVPDADSDSLERATSLRESRVAEARSAQNGLSYLADETGGTFYRNQNYLDKPVRSALSIENGYYLIAYEPDDDTFKGKNFNKIDVRTNRPELKVAARAGFLGVTDEQPKPVKRASEYSDLYDAIAAPLPTGGLNLQLTAFFDNSATDGNVVRSQTHIDGSQITFADEPGGMKKAVFDVVAVTLNEKNEVADEFTRTHIFKIDARAIPLIRENGLVYTTDVPVKKPGTYNFRVAVRDVASRSIGSASQTVQVPNIKSEKLFLAGMNIAKAGPDGKFSLPAGAKPENALSMIASTSVPALRRFRKGDVLAYGYTIYNAKLDAASGLPKLTVQMNLYRNGELINEGAAVPADLEKQSDWTRIKDYAYLRLNSEVEPGYYAIQVTVKDLSAKSATASQLIDFEVVQ